MKNDFTGLRRFIKKQNFMKPLFIEGYSLQQSPITKQNLRQLLEMLASAVFKMTLAILTVFEPVLPNILAVFVFHYDFNCLFPVQAKAVQPADMYYFTLTKKYVS